MPDLTSYRCHRSWHVGFHTPSQAVHKVGWDRFSDLSSPECSDQFNRFRYQALQPLAPIRQFGRNIHFILASQSLFHSFFRTAKRRMNASWCPLIVITDLVPSDLQFSSCNYLRDPLCLVFYVTTARSAAQHDQLKPGILLQSCFSTSSMSHRKVCLYLPLLPAPHTSIWWIPTQRLSISVHLLFSQFHITTLLWPYFSLVHFFILTYHRTRWVQRIQALLFHRLQSIVKTRCILFLSPLTPLPIIFRQSP